MQVDQEKWNNYWKEHQMFIFDEKDNKKELFVIDTPPPFTGGELHLGQAFWICYIDSIARFKYMNNYNVLYPQGWDAQGFPIEIAVEKKYGKNMSKNDFYDKCAEVSKENIDIMKMQMLQLGSSFDEKHQYITISKEYRAKVQLSLILMHEKNMIYRGAHPIEFCTYCESGISREDTEEKQQETMLNYIEFKIKNHKKGIVIATTRPELMHSCVAIAVNPEDSRYKKLIGKEVETPIFNKKVKIISDNSVEKDFGTGAEMICTFGDKNDVIAYYKHKLELIKAIDEKGNLKNAGNLNGLKLKEARQIIIKKLEEEKLIIKQEKINNTVKIHGRCGTSIEFIISSQWFIKTKENSKKILEIAKQIKWIPEYSINRLEDWVNYIEWDWNISRNRIFGTPIPFWHCEKCNYIVAPKKEILPINPNTQLPEIKICPKCKSKIIADQETCDVWVDSSITPLIIAGWPENKTLFNKAFPAAIRIQGSDIIRTWAFYTIFRVWALIGAKPFENLLTHGMILGADKKEMHKSLGNGISPVELIDKYSVDAVRLWAILSGKAEKDKVFSYQEIEYAKAFVLKLYNSSIFVKKAFEKEPIKTSINDMDKIFGLFDLWILNRLNTTIKEVNEAYEKFNLYEAMNKAINFYRTEFCDYYIENVKYRIYNDNINEANRDAAKYCLKYVLLHALKLFAPVIPYISEEINSYFEKETVFNNFPKYTKKASEIDYVINGLVFQSAIVDIDPENSGIVLNDIIADIRKYKSNKKLALNKELNKVEIDIPERYERIIEIASIEIKNICKIKKIIIKAKKQYKINIVE